MNRYLQILVLVLFPFYPLWAWFFQFAAHKHIQEYNNYIWLPLVFYFILNRRNRFPKYLWYLLIFTFYNLFSIYYFDLLPENMGWFHLILSDYNVYACAVFFIIENIKFEDWFYPKMNRNILIILLISALVSLIQVTDPYFFLNKEVDPELEYIGAGRILSIFSWTDINSLGISFPIILAILLSVVDTKKIIFWLIVISGIVIAFLTKARYVMISSIIAFSQLLVTSAITTKRKIYFGIVLLFSVVMLIQVADSASFNIQEVIEDRIFEKSNETEMGSAMVRVTSYYVFLTKFPEHPWFGVGPKTRDDVIQLLGGEAPLIHVGYLSYLYYYGIIGFLFLLIALYFLIVQAYDVGRRFKFWGSFFGILTFCFANTTFVYFNLGEMGFILAVIYIKIFRDRLEDENEKIEGPKTTLLNQ